MSKKIDWSQLTRQHYTKVGERFDLSPLYLAGATLMENVLQEAQGNLAEMEVEGEVASNEEDKIGLRYFSKIEKRGGRLLHKMIYKDAYEATFLFDHGVVRVEYGTEYLKVQALSHDETFVIQLHKEIDAELLPRLRRGHIFAIVRNGAHLQISSIGDASIPLVPGNYTEKVIADYHFAIKDLKTAAPSGRIVIMEGEAGTGKTHLIRAMLDEVPDAMFVLISPEMVPSLAGPELLPLLTQHKQNYDLKGPIILVLEDADRCLVTRASDNISSIQSLLNLGDGILGSLLDLRIIATTNAKKLEMEAAILRPGRLSKRMEVGALDFYTARSIFNRLLPDAVLPEKLKTESRSFKMTLAEAYALARSHGWEPEVREVKEKNNQTKKSHYKGE